MSEIQDNVLKPAKLDQYGKTRPIESTLPSEIMEKAREYAKTIEHSYADTREELEEDVAEAWAKGFIFCLQGKVEAIYKDKEETIQKLTDENKELKSWKCKAETYMNYLIGIAQGSGLEKDNLVLEAEQFISEVEK